MDDSLLAVWSAGSATLRAVKEALEAYRGNAIDPAAFTRAAQTALDRGLIALAADAPGAITLNTRVRLPDSTLFAEAQLTPRELQDFAEIVQEVIRAAPELTFSFRLNLSAEGAKPSPEVIAALNDLLAKVSRKWKLE